jgi:prepilin-type processing-associated H-X9-DG protein
MPGVPNSNYVGVMGGASGPTGGSTTTTSGVDSGWFSIDTSVDSSGAKLWYNNGVIYLFSRTRIPDITDGTTNVFMVGETWYMYTPTSTATAYASWAGNAYGMGGSQGSSGCCSSPVMVAAANDPINNGKKITISNSYYTGPFNPGVGGGGDSTTITRGFGSRHGSGCNFVMCDGSVRFFSESMDVNAYRQMGSRNDELPLGSSN